MDAHGDPHGDQAHVVWCGVVWCVMVCGQFDETDLLPFIQAAKVVIDVLQQKVLRGESKVRRGESKLRKGESVVPRNESGEDGEKPKVPNVESESREDEPLDATPLEANRSKGRRSRSPGERGKPDSKKRKGVHADHEDHDTEPHATETHAREHTGVRGTKKKMRRRSLDSSSQADPPPCSSPTIDGDTRDLGSPQSLVEHSSVLQSSPEGLSGEGELYELRHSRDVSLSYDP